MLSPCFWVSCWEMGPSADALTHPSIQALPESWCGLCSPGRESGLGGQKPAASAGDNTHGLGCWAQGAVPSTHHPYPNLAIGV